MKTITIRIARDGSVKAETHGLKGKECLPYIGVLEQLTDAQVVDSHFTDEYYEGVAETTVLPEVQREQEWESG